MTTFIAISLGWGVQSFTLAAMSALGELPPVDVAIHADTTHESVLTYRFAARWTTWLERHGVKVATPYPGRIDPVNNGYGWPDAPFYSDPEGQIKRQCTSQWKVKRIRRYVQAHRNGQPVEQWLGISTDEWQRMRDSDVKYITNKYPLIDHRMSRADCVKWLEGHGLEVPPKSACTFCPYHNTAEWRRIKATPEDWAEAVHVDEAIRKARPPYDLFVHPSRKPLTSVDLRTEQEKGQLSLWDAECAGICGV